MVVAIVFDLRYTDWELFVLTRETFITAVSEILALSRASAITTGSDWHRVELFAANATGLVPIWNSVCDPDKVTDAMGLLAAMDAVRSPSRDTDQRILYALQELRLVDHTSAAAADRQKGLFFFTSFTNISDFSRLVHLVKLAAIPFMDSNWVSLHLDATAMTTTSLAVTPAIRSIRCPISPALVRSAVQQSLSAFFHLRPEVPVLLRFGRYTVPCAASRFFFTLPSRCCTADDLEAAREGVADVVGDDAAVVLSGRQVCVSQFERERRVAGDVVLTVEGVVNPGALSDSLLYGDGWSLWPRDTDGGGPTEWMFHLHSELRGDVLVLTTQQPLLDPPHQLALPTSAFVAFFLRPTQLYLRALIPPELRAERVETLEPHAVRHRLNSTLSEEIKKTVSALRTDFFQKFEKRPAGVCRMLAQLKLSQRFTLSLERSRASTKRDGGHVLHSIIR